MPPAISVVCRSLCMLFLLALAGDVLARSTDRNQPMNIESSHQEGTLDGNSVNILTGNVTITQGSLDIRSNRAEIYQRGGEASRAVLTGQPATLKQLMEDGSPMTARADKIDYDLTTDIVVLTGNFTVSTPRGTSSGQRLTYNLKTGQVESGGEGNGRVKLVILPKSARSAPAPTSPPKSKSD